MENNNTVQNVVHGFKVFRPDWTCSPNGNTKQYTCPGKFEEEGELDVCGHGMHFCQTATVPILPSSIYPIENVLILAIQCSKPATTNDIIMQNIIISFPLSLFNLVPTSTAIHTRKLQRIPLSKSSGTPADIFEYIKLL